jgi:hypothetical protein
MAVLYTLAINYKRVNVIGAEEKYRRARDLNLCLAKTWRERLLHFPLSGPISGP